MLKAEKDSATWLAKLIAYNKFTNLSMDEW
jgi:hypothetical protein